MDKQHNKSYIILGENKDGNYIGYCECSFSMDSDPERVKVYNTETEYSDYWKSYYFSNKKRKEAKIAINHHKRSKKYVSFIQDTQITASMNPNSKNQLIWFYLRECANDLNKQHYKDCIWKVFRLNSKNCPVIVDMKESIDMKNKKIPYNKYNWRNHKFFKK